MLGMMCLYDRLSERIWVLMTRVDQRDCDCSSENDYMHELRWGYHLSTVEVPECECIPRCDCMVELVLLSVCNVVMLCGGDCGE